VQEQVTDIVEGILTEFPELFLVTVVLKGTEANQKVIVLIDGEPSVTIDHCATLSRKLAAVLEERDLFKDRYNLEVSSPGLDMPLLLPRQYRKNIGRTLKIVRADGSQLEGRVSAADEEKVILLEGKKEQETAIPFKEIVKANVSVSFKEK